MTQGLSQASAELSTECVDQPSFSEHFVRTDTLFGTDKFCHSYRLYPAFVGQISKGQPLDHL